MTVNTEDQREKIAQCLGVLNAIKNHINGIVVGQTAVVDQVLVALLANGHVLLEGVPGLGKTLLVHTFARCFDGGFKRIQFTPDLMPADITGHTLYDMQERKFRLRRGPIFTNFLLADEINRATGKTQAALLEVMQEKQVTIEGESIALTLPFMTLATQNPIEQEGTYPLPEAELDRFLLNIVIDYPNAQDEALLANHVVSGQLQQKNQLTAPALNGWTVPAMQALCAQVLVDDAIVEYAVRLVRATRSFPLLRAGAGPRATIGLLQAARAKALLRGDAFVLPDDIKALAAPVLRHRIFLTAEADIEQLSADSIIQKIIASTETPRQ